MTDKAPTDKRGADSVQRLVRSSPHHLEVVGLRCGIQRPWEKEPCGGKLFVRDWHPRGFRGQWRYEIQCEKCHTCDPNGWARQDEILPAAREHFHALADTANVRSENTVRSSEIVGVPRGYKRAAAQMDAITRQFKDGSSMMSVARKHSLPLKAIEFVIRMKMLGHTSDVNRRHNTKLTQDARP